MLEGAGVIGYLDSWSIGYKNHPTNIRPFQETLKLNDYEE